MAWHDLLDRLHLQRVTFLKPKIDAFLKEILDPKYATKDEIDGITEDLLVHIWGCERWGSSEKDISIKEIKRLQQYLDTSGIVWDKYEKKYRELEFKEGTGDGETGD